MELSLAGQASSLGISVLLGAGLALVYDLLRALRLRGRTRRGVTAALDALFCAVLALCALRLSLSVGGGELRLYMLFGMAAGIAGSEGLLSPLFAPLWAFWADALLALLHALRLPLRLGRRFLVRLHKLCKRLFLFSRSAFIINSYRGRVRRVPPAGGGETKHGKEAGKTKSRTSRPFGDGRAAGIRLR